MHTLIICLLIVALLPVISKLILAIPMASSNGYDNAYPRLQQNTLRGFGARALGAHQNSFEALTLFSAAVLTAIATQHLSVTIQYLSIFYVCSRIIYHGLYLLNLSTLRSIVWFLGFLACISILWMCTK